VADIILAVDEPIDATRCHGMQNCKDDEKCLTHDLWEELNKVIFDYLHSVSLAALVDGQGERALTILRRAEKTEAQGPPPRPPALSA
jgi:Rrf2 family iron-sulfur cluster assembly transcriptional regulator